MEARELYIETKEPNWYHLRTADPAFIKFPWALRAIRKDSDTQNTISGGPDAEHCKEGCSEFEQLKIKFGGKRILSVERLVSGDDGSPRGFSNIEDFTYSVQSQERIRFGDIFTSWPEAQARLQRAFCESLDFKRQLPRYTLFDGCPPIDNMVFFLVAGSGDTERVSHILIRSGICIIGPCAAVEDSAANENIYIDKNLGELIKPDYLSDFLVYDDLQSSHDETVARSETANAAASSQRPDTIKLEFDTSTCEHKGDFREKFDELVKKVEEWRDNLGPDDDETKPHYLKLDEALFGLRVTAITIGYSSGGIIFAEDEDQVKAAFLRNGFSTKPEDVVGGEVLVNSSRDHSSTGYTTISKTEFDDTNYGNSIFSCGV